MTEQKFKDLLDRMYTYYGHKETLPKEAHREYFNMLKGTPDGAAGRVYSMVLRQFKFFPTVSEFREIAEVAREKDGRRKNSSRCWYCMDRGRIDYIRMGDSVFLNYPYEYVARCPKCDAGNNYRGWPAFDVILGSDALEEVRLENIRKYSSGESEAENRAKVQDFMEQMRI